VVEATQHDQTEPVRIDYLTFAQGALFVQQTGLATGSSGAALLAIDGDPYRLSLTTDRNGPVELVYKLPANMTFDRFAIPAEVEQPGNVTFVKSVTVSGSLEGPDTGYQVLAAFELTTHGPDQEVTEVAPDVVTPVRWVKVRYPRRRCHDRSKQLGYRAISKIPGLPCTRPICSVNAPY